MTPAGKGRGRPPKRKSAGGWGGARARARVVETPESQASLVASLKLELGGLRTQLRRKESDLVQAVRAEVFEEVRQLREQSGELVLSAARARAARVHSVKAEEAGRATISRLEKELLDAVAEAHEQRERADEMKEERGVLRLRVAVKERMIAARDDKLNVLKQSSQLELEAVTQQLAESEQKCVERLSTIRQVMGKLGGRPVVTRDEEALKECDASTAYSCMVRMAARLQAEIGECGAEGAMCAEAVMKGLRDGGWLPTIWESEVIWEWRMDWLHDKRDDLRVVWCPELTFQLRDKLSLSLDKIDELRQTFSHYRVGKQLHPRPWAINPWTGARLTFPQPVAPRNGVNGWYKLVKLSVAKWGLSMDKEGRIAQRSFTATVQKQVARDQARGILTPITESKPLTFVLGADGTGVGKRGIMHVGVSISPSYQEGISQQNERNLNTIACSVTDDHWGGLNETLCSGFYTGKVDELPTTCIAAEVDKINASGRLDSSTPARGVGCFDLVAARGIRGGRGRCACHTEATTAEERFSVPAVEDCDEWASAFELLSEVELLRNGQMRDDSHTPPLDWDYEAQGPWQCARERCDVKFMSHAQYIEYRDAFLAAKADKSPQGKKTTTARATAYSKLHPSGQGECEPPLISLDMKDILIDPLHALMLNLPKVLWKYSFGDRMTNSQRELVAEYLTSIGCPLDVRAKGDGRDANRKWFTGEVFAKFVEGDAKDESPGLVANINAIIDIIYVKCPDETKAAPSATPPVAAASAAPAPAPAAPAANLTKRNGGGGAKIRRGGFSVAAPPVAAPPVAASTSAPAAAPAAAAAAPAPAAAAARAPAAAAARAPAPESAEDAKLREKYKSHMDIVKLTKNGWAKFCELYVEWRTAWTSRTTTYAQTRALTFAKLAATLSSAMKAVSLGKHKSWYYYLVVWVVPRQMAEWGDTWAYSTSPIEQRGARLKRIIRSVVSWRPVHDGWVPVAGPAPLHGQAPQAWLGRRKYESCAMMQLLRACVAQEELWAEPVLEGAALSVSEMRMQRTGRTTLIKDEEGKGHRLPKLLEEVIDLT